MILLALFEFLAMNFKADALLPKFSRAVTIRFTYDDMWMQNFRECVLSGSFNCHWSVLLPMASSYIRLQSASKSMTIRLFV